jgi:hypothetical protein
MRIREKRNENAIDKKIARKEEEKKNCLKEKEEKKQK